MSVIATLKQPPKENIFETTANAEYSCTASLPENTQSEYYQYKYSDLTYEWTFSDDGTSSASSGTHTFTGLVKGAKNVIYGSVKVTCTQKHFTRDDVYASVDTGKTDKDGKPIKEEKWVGYSEWELTGEPNTDYPVGEASIEQLTIYTHPGTSTVYAGLAFGLTIQTNLTSGVVAKWVEHCGKWRSWWFQSDQYNSANGCNVNSNDVITAGWFNSCIAMAEASSPIVRGGATGTIISADLFKQQDELISRRE